MRNQSVEAQLKAKVRKFETSLMQHLSHGIQTHPTEETWKKHCYQQV